MSSSSSSGDPGNSLKTALSSLPPNRLGHLLLDADTKVIESSGCISPSLAAEVLAQAAQAAVGADNAEEGGEGGGEPLQGRGLEDSADEETLGRAAKARLEGKTIAVACTDK